jgi:outer membrane murein-binding lipoprotein Lpp
MHLFKKKPDPISDRAKALNAEIAALEAQIKKLAASVQPPSQPRLSARLTSSHLARANPREPIFEEIDRERLIDPSDSTSRPAKEENLGVHRFSMAAAWQRLLNYFRTPPPANPKLLNYLAAGSIQGLRPLRYEKRIARYRLIFLCICLLFVLWIIVEWFRSH